MLSLLPISAFYAILGGLVATTLLHELGHGCVLAHHGGMPRRLGVMLFYLMPAFYCDVSDGWRLSRREQRVGVALAGVVTQSAVAGAAALAAAMTPPGDPRVCLLVFSVTCYFYGLVNLIPFVKLDGYIALMSYLDVPHLRAKATADAQRAIRRLIAGTHERRELSGRWWAVPYGLCCLILPPVLVVGALSMWETTLLSLGRFGAALCLLLLAYVAYYAFRGATRFVYRVRRLTHSRRRLVFSSLVLVVGAVTLLSVATLPYEVRGGYIITSSRAELALPPGADVKAVVPGRTVSLQLAGLALRQTVGDATVAGGGMVAQVPISAFVPVRSSDNVTVSARVYPLAAVRGKGLPRSGPAIVHAGSRHLGSWLVERYVSPLLRALRA